MVNSQYQKIKDRDEQEYDLTEFYLDIGLETLFRRFSAGDSNLNDIKPPGDHIEAFDFDLPGDYDKFMSGGTASFEVEDDRGAEKAHPWFDEEADSRQGCLKIAKAVYDQVGLGDWITTNDVDELQGVSYSGRTLRRYMNSLAKSHMFEKEDGKPNKYKMVEDWRK